MPAKKTTKTTASKKSPTKRVNAKVQAARKVKEETQSESSYSAPGFSIPSAVAFFKKRRKYLLFIVATVLLIFLAYYYKQLFVVAVVNGQPITRLTYYQELEKQAGEQALNTIVTKMIVMQEAQKQKITVTNEEIDKEVKSIEDRLKSQGQSLDTLLLFQGLTRDGLKEQLRLQKLAEKMAGKDIKISDKEIDDYLAANPSTESATAGQVDSKAQRDDAKEKVRQQKLSDAIQKWIENLRAKANIQRFLYFNTPPAAAPTS